jgi:hypothetical protein
VRGSIPPARVGMGWQILIFNELHVVKFAEKEVENSALPEDTAEYDDGL